MSAWQVQIARITLFPLLGSVAFPASALDLYKAIVGKDPDNFQNQRPPATPFLNSVAQGLNQGLSFSCQVQPARVDCTFSPGPVATPFADRLPVIQDSQLLRFVMEKAIDSIGVAVKGAKVSRLATYLQIGQEVTSSAEGNRILIDALPEAYKVRLDDEEDFILQINRPSTTSGEEPQRLNLIIKWSVDRVQVLTFLAGQNPSIGGQFASGAPVISNKLTSTIVFDNSSAPANTPIDDSQVSTILASAFARIRDQLSECKVSLKGFENAPV